jgi:hypothetical protein
MLEHFGFIGIALLVINGLGIVIINILGILYPLMKFYITQFTCKIMGYNSGITIVGTLLHYLIGLIFKAL